MANGWTRRSPIEGINPATGARYARVQQAGPPEVERAVAAAYRARAPWGTPDMRIYHEESFGPIVSLLAARDAEDALAFANGMSAARRLGGSLGALRRVERSSTP